MWGLRDDFYVYQSRYIVSTEVFFSQYLNGLEDEFVCILSMCFVAMLLDFVYLKLLSRKLLVMYDLKKNLEVLSI